MPVDASSIIMARSSIQSPQAKPTGSMVARLKTNIYTSGLDPENPALPLRVAEVCRCGLPN